MVVTTPKAWTSTRVTSPPSNRRRPFYHRTPRRGLNSRVPTSIWIPTPTRSLTRSKAKSISQLTRKFSTDPPANALPREVVYNERSTDGRGGQRQPGQGLLTNPDLSPTSILATTSRVNGHLALQAQENSHAQHFCTFNTQGPTKTGIYHNNQAVYSKLLEVFSGKNLLPNHSLI